MLYGYEDKEQMNDHITGDASQSYQDLMHDMKALSGDNKEGPKGPGGPTGVNAQLRRQMSDKNWNDFQSRLKKDYP